MTQDAAVGQTRPFQEPGGLKVRSVKRFSLAQTVLQPIRDVVIGSAEEEESYQHNSEDQPNASLITKLGSSRTRRAARPPHYGTIEFVKVLDPLTPDGVTEPPFGV